MNRHRDEKRILYDNPEKSTLWLNPGGKLKHYPKKKLLTENCQQPSHTLFVWTLLKRQGKFIRIKSNYLNPKQGLQSILYNKRKLSLSIHVSFRSNFHHGFLRSGLPMATDRYCKEMRTWMEGLAKKNVANQRIFTFYCTTPERLQPKKISSLQELQIETLHHPPFPSVTTFFYLDHHLQGEQFS